MEQRSIPWLTQFRNIYKAGVAHTFTLHSNITDYVDMGCGLPVYLTNLFADRDLIVHLDRARGLTFPLEAHRSRFLEILRGGDEPSSEGLDSLLGQEDLPRDLGGMLTALDQVLTTTSCALVVEHAELLLPAGEPVQLGETDRRALVFFLQWARDSRIASLGNPILLLCDQLTDLHPAVRAPGAKIEAVAIPWPGPEERLCFIDRLLAAHPDLCLGEGVDRKKLANLTAGLSRILIEDIILRGLADGDVVTLTHVRERVESIIRTQFADVLAIVEPQYGFEAVGGLDHVKRYLLAHLVSPLRNGERNHCPMGLLLTGPAGTGKTVIAEALAKEAGVNFVELNLGRILGPYVGTSERNLEKALSAIETLTPAIVFIDEIDQAVQRGGQGDSGVGNRLFKRLLEFMSNTGHRGRVVFLAATNRPDLMDAAFKRPGRFDRKIPFFIPETDEERATILEVLGNRYFPENLVTDWNHAATATDGYSGADLESLVIKAGEIARENGRTSINDIDLGLACRVILPSTADVERMTRLALLECNDLSLVPPGYLDRVRFLRKERAA